MNLEDLRKSRAELKTKTDISLENMQTIANESYRVADLASNSRVVLKDLDSEFEKQTGLDETDVTFLFFATALQVARWVILNLINREFTQKIDDSRLKDNDKSIKKKEREKREKYKQKHDNWDHHKSEKYPTWLEIVFDGVPFDVSVGSPQFNVNMGAGYHRVHTLGHDPLWGWIFGTINIISSTITLEDFRTYKVEAVPKPKHWAYKSNILDAFRMSIESIQEDDKRLPAAIFAEALHLESDAFTKNGLPIPLLETFDPSLAGELYKNNYDSLCLVKDLTIINLQSSISILINMLITLIHGLYYDPDKFETREIYEAKTRKILMYSNLISMNSNLIWVGGNALIGNETEWTDLDIGGFIVTMYRLVTDTNYIQSIKEEFVFGEFNKLIQGTN